MKVIQVIPSLSFAGAEVMCKNLSCELKRNGIDVSVICLYDTQTALSEQMEEAGIKIHYLGKKGGFDRSVYRKLRKILKVERPDVIHTHLHVLKYVTPAAFGLHAKILHTVHSIAQKESGSADKYVNLLSYKLCRIKPVALSTIVQQTIVDTYKIKAAKIPIVYNGVTLDRCIPKSDYSIKGAATILHIGRFEEAKNHVGMIKGYAKYCQKHPDSRLWLVGDGDKRAEIEALVAELGLQENVVFWGKQSNVFEYLQKADVFILPSLYEGIPLTVAEAMGSGLPIIASNVGGIPDMIVNETHGLLIDVNEDALADALERMTNDVELRAKLGRAAKEESVRFSAQKMTEDYCEIYRSK